MLNSAEPKQTSKVRPQSILGHMSRLLSLLRGRMDGIPTCKPTRRESTRNSRASQVRVFMSVLMIDMNKNVKFGRASTELSKEWHDLSEDEKEKYSPQGGSLSDCDAITFSNLDRKTNKHKLWRQMQRQVDSLSSFILLTGSAIFLMHIVE